MVEVAPGTAGRDEAMSLAHCMTTLADGSVDPERVDLFPLSGLAHSEVEEFQGVWDSIEPRRRRTILSTMADKARDNIQFDFSTIFLTCLRDADEDVRLLSIHGLGEYEDRSALAPLIDMLRADDRRGCAPQPLRPSGGSRILLKRESSSLAMEGGSRTSS